MDILVGTCRTRAPLQLGYSTTSKSHGQDAWASDPDSRHRLHHGIISNLRTSIKPYINFKAEFENRTPSLLATSYATSGHDANLIAPQPSCHPPSPPSTSKPDPQCLDVASYRLTVLSPFDQVRLGTWDTKAEPDSTLTRRFSNVVSVSVELRVKVAPDVITISVKLLHEICNRHCPPRRRDSRHTRVNGCSGAWKEACYHTALH